MADEVIEWGGLGRGQCVGANVRTAGRYRRTSRVGLHELSPLHG